MMILGHEGNLLCCPQRKCLKYWVARLDNIFIMILFNSYFLIFKAFKNTKFGCIFNHFVSQNMQFEQNKLFPIFLYSHFSLQLSSVGKTTVSSWPYDKT